MSGRMVVDVASMLRSCDRTGTATGTAGADPFWQARPDMGGTSTGAAIDDGITLGPRSPFEPVGVTPRYDPPRAWIDPDRERSWVARMQPIVVAHRGLLVVGRGGVGRRDDRPGRHPGGGPGGDRRRAGRPHRRPRALRLGAARPRRAPRPAGVRLPLRPLPHGLRHRVRPAEHRLRAPRPACRSPSTTASSRARSSRRANSDIRSVQMFLAFAPLIVISLLSFVRRARRSCSRINVPLTLRGRRRPARRVPRRARRCATACSRCRGSSRPAWPTSPRSSTRTSTACGS